MGKSLRSWGGGIKRMKIQLSHNYGELISLDNLMEAWREFARDKRQKKDVQIFSLNLMDNILQLHSDLLNHTYNHGGYQHFKINDPKPRDIHKASVRDRLVHHAIYRQLYPFFDKVFIADSFSCRLNKGTHRAIKRFREFAYRVSKNNTKICWVLKCDIKKFFANINHDILLVILREYIPDQDILGLLENIIHSFSSGKVGTGLPLGNLTSQLLVNIYMNRFDQFIKHKLKVNYYIRYADDFVLIADNADFLRSQIPQIDNFLKNELKLTLHPNKISIKTLDSGIDFLGYVNFFNYSILRAKTKRRMLSRVNETNLSSYLGLLKHCRGYNLMSKIFKIKNHKYTL